MAGIERIHSDRAPRAIGPYSQAVKVDGWIYCSGQIPLDIAGDPVGKDDVAGQAEQVLTNLAAVLEASGASLASVVKTTVFLVDLADFTEMNEVYARHFGDHRPARSTVAVAGLPRGVRIEIDAVARAR